MPYCCEDAQAYRGGAGYLASSQTGIHMRALVLHALMSAGGSAIRAANLSGRSSCQTKALSMHEADQGLSSTETSLFWSQMVSIGWKCCSEISSAR